MSSLITVVGRAGLNRNVFRSQEDILSRSKAFFCPSTWLEGVDQKASSEVAILEINCDNMVRLTKCMSGSRKLFLSIYSPQKYKNGMKLADLLKNSNVVDSGVDLFPDSTENADRTCRLRVADSDHCVQITMQGHN